MSHDHGHVNDNGNEVHVEKTPTEKRREECDKLCESVDWSNVPDWARLLWLEMQSIKRDEDV